MTIMDTLKQKNPELYDRLMRLGTMGEREGAWDDEAYYQYGLAKDVDVPRGQSVGPYDVYVASSPISRLAGGVEKGMHLGRMSEALNRRRGLADETAQTRGDVAQEALMAGSNLGGSAAGMPEPGAPRNHAQRLRDRPRSGAEFPDGVEPGRQHPADAAAAQLHAGP
jgi:hypothetical protein